MHNFRLGIEDAELMEPVYAPDFNQYDLANLPMGNCYVSLKTGGNKPVAVSMETVYEKGKPGSGHIVEKLRAASMKKYTLSVEKADKNIEERFKKIEHLMDES